MSEDRPVFEVLENVPISELAKTLNDWLAKGYQLHSKDLIRVEDGPLGSTSVTYVYVVTVFDPALLGAKQAASMTASLGNIMQNLQAGAGPR
jgi:hypothetical protein